MRRQEVPFYVGAGEPLLPLDEPMDAVFVRARRPSSMQREALWLQRHCLRARVAE